MLTRRIRRTTASRPSPRRAGQWHATGTRFRRQDQHRHERSADVGKGSGGANDTRTVLIVDDEESIRLICRINFTSSGWQCVEAANGNEALDAVKRERPDVVLLDVMMPELDGWAVAERLTDDPATSDIPIVFLTARADMRDRVQAHAAGAVGFVTKPVNPVTLPAFIDEILARVERGEREQLRAELLESDI